MARLSASVGAVIRPSGDGAWLEVVDREPSPDLLAAVTAGCLAAGWLIVESRSVGGSLEDAYLALVAEAAA